MHFSKFQATHFHVNAVGWASVYGSIAPSDGFRQHLLGCGDAIHPVGRQSHHAAKAMRNELHGTKPVPAFHQRHLPTWWTPTLEVEHSQYLSQVGVRLAWWKIWALSSVLNDQLCDSVLLFRFD